MKISFLGNTILRNRRSDYSTNKTENKHIPDEKFSFDKLVKPDKLVAELKKKLGPTGERGARGRRGNIGRSGNKRDNGIMGPPGRSGKQGIMGPTGSKGETGLKGDKGDTGTADIKGTAGMKGAKGEPSESIGAPTVAVSPAKSKTASFQCSVSGNPKPVSTWSKLEGKSEKNLSATRDGRLILPNAAGSDSGVYKCSASSVLGQAQALVRLVVNGKFCYVNRLCWFSHRSKSNTTLGPSNYIGIQFDFQQCGLCSKLWSKVCLNWFSLLILYSSLLRKVFVQF